MVRIKEAVDILQIHGVTEQGATMPIRVSLVRAKRFQPLRAQLNQPM